jgi:hypothetical protein
MSKKSEESERSESLMRIVVGVISGIIFYLWTYAIGAFILVNFFYTLIKGQRSKDVANLCEIYNSQIYSFWKYMTFVSNKRPFPFENMTKNISKFE